MKKRIRTASFILLLLALLEHLTAWLSFLYDRLTQMEKCDWEIGSMFFYLATTHLSQIYAELPITIFTVLWAEYMNISFTFVWNFIDIFIIIVSIGVAAQFEKINKRLEFFRGRASGSVKLVTDNLRLWKLSDCFRQFLGRDSLSLQRGL